MRRDWRRVVARCVAKNPDDRYQDFGDLLADLRNDASTSQITQAESHSGRSRSLRILAAIVVGVFTLAPLFFLIRGLIQGAPESEPTDVSSLQASDHQAHARALMQNFSNPQDLSLALESWQKVLDLRPDYAPALAGMATTRALIVWNSSPEPDLMKTAEAEARLQSAR